MTSEEKELIKLPSDLFLIMGADGRPYSPEIFEGYFIFTGEGEETSLKLIARSEDEEFQGRVANLFLGWRSSAGADPEVTDFNFVDCGSFPPAEAMGIFQFEQNRSLLPRLPKLTLELAQRADRRTLEHRSTLANSYAVWYKNSGVNIDKVRLVTR